MFQSSTFSGWHSGPSELARANRDQDPLYSWKPILSIADIGRALEKQLRSLADLDCPVALRNATTDGSRLGRRALTPLSPIMTSRFGLAAETERRHFAA
jgi:hypothetical protein